MPQYLKPRVFAGTGTMFFAAVNLFKIPPYFLLGQFSRQNLSRLPQLDQRIAGVILIFALIRGGGAWRANLG